MDIINSGISTDELSNNFKAEVILALIATKLKHGCTYFYCTVCVLWQELVFSE